MSVRRLPEEDRVEVEEYRNAQHGAPRREVLYSLWLNRAIAGKLVRDSDRVLAIGRKNVARFRVMHRGSSMLRWLDAWEKIIDQGAEAVLQILTSESAHARDLRQTSPFPGVLTQRERMAVLTRFGATGRAAPYEAPRTRTRDPGGLRSLRRGSVVYLAARGTAARSQYHSRKCNTSPLPARAC